MQFDPATEIQTPKLRLSANRYWQKLAVSTLVMLVFVVFWLAPAGGQNPNCLDLKRKADDATRVYETARMQSQLVGEKVISYRSIISKLQDQLVANNKRRTQSEKALADAQNDRGRCERDHDVLPAGGCANVRQRIAAAEKNIAYARANQEKIEADLLSTQTKLAAEKSTLAAANASLTTAQQDLEAVNNAYLTAGCSSDSKRR